MIFTPEHSINLLVIAGSILIILQTILRIKLKKKYYELPPLKSLAYSSIFYLIAILIVMRIVGFYQYKLFLPDNLFNNSIAQIIGAGILILSVITFFKGLIK